MKLVLTSLIHVFIHALVSRIFVKQLLLCETLGIGGLGRLGSTRWKVGGEGRGEAGRADEAGSQHKGIARYSEGDGGGQRTSRRDS